MLNNVFKPSCVHSSKALTHVIKLNDCGNDYKRWNTQYFMVTGCCYGHHVFRIL